MRRGRGSCSLSGDFDYSGYSDQALAEARELWRRELQNEAFPADWDLASRKIAAIRAELARRQETRKDPSK